MRKIPHDSSAHTYFSEQGQGVVFHKGLVAVLVHCVCAQLLQSEAACKGDARVADVILQSNTRTTQSMSCKSAQACATMLQNLVYSIA